MLKFQRNYYCEFAIYKNNKIEEIVTVSYPTTLNFNVIFGSYNSPMTASLQFINLSKEIQGKLWIDRFNWGLKRIKFNLFAGYGDTLINIFGGEIQDCISYRESGSTDWITEVSGYISADYRRLGLVNDTFIKGTKVTTILKYMMSQNSDIKLGSISPSLDYSIPRNQTFIGQPMDLIGRSFPDYRVFVDKNELHILGANEVIEGENLIISDKTGLLGSPKRANVFLEIEMMFEPQANIGRMATIKSLSMPQFNGDYEIISVRHYGVISPTQSGVLTTSLVLSSSREIKKVPRQENKEYTGENTATWQKPVDGKVTDNFGYRMHPIKKQKIFHNGIDIEAALNTPVKAPANGKVTVVGWLGGYGKAIQIDNGIIKGKRVTSLYGHLNSWAVSNGDNVTTGQIIGYVGSSGNSTGAHLHFEVKENGTAVNPTKYIGTF